MTPRGSLLRKRLSIVLPIGLVIFALAELVSWIRRKPPLSLAAPSTPGTSVVAFPLNRAPSPASPRVWTGASTPLELRIGDTVTVWTRVEPMTPTRLAELEMVMLAVQLKSGPENSTIGLCAMHKSGAPAWTELCGDASPDVCLRTATECVLTAPSPGPYTVEASVEWIDGREAPKTATLEAFVKRAN